MTKGEFVSSWTPTAPSIVQRTVRTAEDGEFTAGPRAVLRYKDLGLSEATGGGRLAAEHLRFQADEPWRSGVHFHHQDFQFCYVLRGSCELRDQDGHTVTTVRPGDVSYLPGFWWHDERLTSDFEVIEILSPARLLTTHGLENPLPNRPEAFASGNQPVFSFEHPEAYEIGAGPRTSFSYRVSDAGRASDGRVHGHVAQAVTEGGDDEWFQAVSSLFGYVVAGTATLDFEGGQVHHLAEGSPYCLEQGAAYRLATWSADFKTFEMWFPGQGDPD